MKHTKRLFAATILTFVLTANALAGDTHNPSVAPPPPPPPVERLRPVVADTTATTSGIYDALTEAALLFCHKVLSIF
jgi:hypothetical protein